MKRNSRFIFSAIIAIFCIIALSATGVFMAKALERTQDVNNPNTFNVKDFSIIEIDVEEEFTFDGRTFINTSDCYLVQYKANISSNLDELISIAKNALEESGYEWQSSQGSIDSHFDIYLGDDVAVKVNFRNYMDEYILELAICASYSNKAVDIISYGYESIYLQ